MLGRGLFLALAWLLTVGIAAACETSPHQTTDMPESVVFSQTPGPGIRTAWYDAPTTRYGHGVLGDAIEAGALYAEAAGPGDGCEVIGIVLDPDHVFEDVAPRLADLDGDGRNEIITVRARLDLGAQLAVYGDVGDGDALRLVVATPFIGQSNRWLAPVGAADLDGDGLVEIAYIDRPHLARILRVWRYRAGTLEEVATLGGLTNHRIGEDYISGGMRDCGGGPEMILATTDWARMVAVRFDGRDLISRDLGPWSDASAAAALACAGN